MRKLFLIIVGLMSMIQLCFSETIKLKSGKTVEGKVIEKTDEYIKIDFYGIPLTYFFENIESIDRQRQNGITRDVKDYLGRSVKRAGKNICLLGIMHLPPGWQDLFGAVFDITIEGKKIADKELFILLFKLNKPLLDLQKKYVELIKRSVNKYNINFIGIESYSAEETSHFLKKITEVLKMAGFADYRELGRDFYLLFVGPVRFLQTVNYEYFREREVQLIALESKSLFNETYDKIFIRKKLMEEVNTTYPKNIVLEYNNFMLGMEEDFNKYNILPSDSQVDKFTTQLFYAYPQLDKEKVKRIIVLHKEIYQAYAERDSYVTDKVLDLSSNANILVVRGLRHVENIKRMLELRSETGKVFDMSIYENKYITEWLENLKAMDLAVLSRLCQ